MPKLVNNRDWNSWNKYLGLRLNTLKVGWYCVLLSPPRFIKSWSKVVPLPTEPATAPEVSWLKLQHINSAINFDQSKWHSQFLMSEMKTANPRIPSPFDTAGILQDFVLTQYVKFTSIRFFAQVWGGRRPTWRLVATRSLAGPNVHCNVMTDN